MAKYPWRREILPGLAQIETDDDEFLTVGKWPKEVFQPHYHDAFNWIIPLRPGTVTVRIEGEEVQIGANEWICILPFAPHTVVHVSDDVEVVGLFISQEDIFAAYEAMSLKPDFAKPYFVGGKGLVAQGLALQWGEYRFNEEARRDGLYESFRAFLCGWLLSHAQRNASFTRQSLDMRIKIALGADGEKVADFLNQHLSDNPFPWGVLEKNLSVSQRSLQRRFASNIGLSPTQLLLEARLERAQALLQDPSLPVVDIALKCGFSSQAHFSTVFKAAAGLSPNAYRKQRSGQLSAI